MSIAIKDGFCILMHAWSDYLDITEGDAIVISIFLYCNKYVFIVCVLASSSVVVACSIVSPVATTVINFNNS